MWKKKVINYIRDFSLGFAKKRSHLGVQTYSLQPEIRHPNRRNNEHRRERRKRKIRRLSSHLQQKVYEKRRASSTTLSTRHIKLMQCPSIGTPQPVFSYVDSRYRCAINRG